MCFKLGQKLHPIFISKSGFKLALLDTEEIGKAVKSV
ncbi:hypothetical protein ACUXI3_000674 [Staphylococcus saprophyticus]